MEIEAVTSALGNFMHGAVIITKASQDPSDNTIVWSNKAFTRLTGRQSSEVIGKTPKILTGANTCKNTLERIHTKIMSGAPVHELILNYTLNGDEIWVDLDIHPIKDDDGRLCYWVEIRRDVTEQVQINEQMEAMNRKLSLCIEGGNIGAWEWDIVTGEVDYSEKNYELLGHHVDSHADNAWFDWWEEKVHKDDIASLKAALDNHIKTDTPYDITYRIRHKNGEWFWWRSIGRANRDKNGVALTMSGVNIDVTEIKKAQAEAEKTNQLKSEFLANMSHEIRTPLNGILGMSQLLERTEISEKQKQYIERINSSGASLLGIINDVLDISKIETGVLELETENFDLNQVMRQAADTIAGPAEQKGLAVNLALDTPPNLNVSGDMNRLRQVLVNLAGNAVKFTDHGAVTLKATLRLDGVEFRITDTGPGIPKSQQEAIFKRFVQGDGSSTRKHGGTGLGLAIAKDLVALMGGTLKVESQEGKGASFFFILSFDEAVDATNTAPTDQRDHAPMPRHSIDAKIRMLVAEDNLVNREIIRATFDDVENVHMEFAENGQEAITHLNHSIFDLVLMDINMPILTGDEAIRIIRKHDTPYTQIPIFVLTADANQEHRQLYIDDGADDCVIKPLNLDDLTRTINLFLKTPDRESSLDIALSMLKRRLTAKEKKNREERVPCQIDAEIESEGGIRIPCTVENLSSAGAGLTLQDERELRSSFRIFLKGMDFSLLSRLAWQRKDKAGVEFLMFADGFQKKRIRRALKAIKNTDCNSENSSETDAA